MMLILTIHDRKGTELKFGDIVKVSCRDRGTNYFTFFAEVKYLEKEQCIAPFHTFAFHSFEKVDSVPDNAVESQGEDRYRIWYQQDTDAEQDPEPEKYDRYLMEWRECEHLLSEKIFRIHLKEPNKQPVQLSLL
jgi:hypothetical protein